MVASRTATLERMREKGGREAKTADVLQGRAAAVDRTTAGAGGAAVQGSAAPLSSSEREARLRAMASDGDAHARAQRQRAADTQRLARITDEAERLALERAQGGGSSVVARALRPAGEQ